LTISDLESYVAPTISVITICYKEPPEKIHFTFSSIASQSYPHIEWIVVDGGSGEETLAAIGEYAGKIAKLISEPDDGIYDAMNKGIASAHGDFLLFMNVRDRLIEPSVLSRMADFIIANPGYDCYYGDAVYFDPKNATSYLGRQERKVGRFQLHYGMISHQATLSSRRMYDRIGPFDKSYRIIADKEWILRSVANGARWKHTGITVSEYETGGISSDPAARKDDTSRVLRQYYGLPERALYYTAKKIRGLWLRPLRALARLKEKENL